jgi:hypothetical protein
MVARSGGSANRTLLFMGLSAVVAAGLTGEVLWLKAGAKDAQEGLEGSKEKYRQMVEMKTKVEDFKQRYGPSPPRPTQGTEDLLGFLNAKARAAGIPMNLFTPSPSQPVKLQGWKEVSCTVTLSGASKESPILRKAIVDFLAFVEEERPSIKSKNLTLEFTGDHFTSATITFSSFQRDP